MKLYPNAATASMKLAITGCTLHAGSGPSGAQPGSAAPVSTSHASGHGGESGTGVPGTASAAPVTITSAPPPGPAVPGRCHTSMLRIAVGAVGAAAGQRYAVLTLTNICGASCRMYGHAAKRLAFRHGGQVPTGVVRTDRAAGPLLTRAPGDRAWTRLHWTVVPAPDQASPTCQASAGYPLVTPPDGTSQLGGRWLGGPVCQHGGIDARHAARAADTVMTRASPQRCRMETGACPAPLRGRDGGAGWAAGPVRHLCGGRPLRRSACQVAGDERDSPSPFGELAAWQEGGAL
jgi:hypothetical protein